MKGVLMATAVDVRHEMEMIAKLQHIDHQLQDLELERGDLPKLVKRLEQEIDQRELELSGLRERSMEIGKERRTMDGQIQLARVKQEKYKEQLYAVTTTREYDAISQEIEEVHKQVESLEGSQMALLQEEEGVADQMLLIEGRIEELKKELEERQTELGDKVSETETEEQELLHEREKLVVRIKKPLVAHYERIRQLRGGTGAAHLYSSACGACFAVVPPQRQAEIRKMEDIILCESCGVILLPEEENMDL